MLMRGLILGPVASIRVVQRKGRPPGYQVLWRDRDKAGKQTSLTFDARADADNFARIVTSSGGSMSAAVSIWRAVQRRSPTVEQGQAVWQTQSD